MRRASDRAALAAEAVAVAVALAVASAEAAAASDAARVKVVSVLMAGEKSVAGCVPRMRICRPEAVGDCDCQSGRMLTVAA